MILEPLPPSAAYMAPPLKVALLAMNVQLERELIAPSNEIAPP